MDSVRPDGADTKLYFKKKFHRQFIGECHDAIIQQTPWLGYFFAMDSLVERNDTVFFSSGYSISPFYFLPKATVGQSWTVTSTYSGNAYDQITVSCTSIEQRTFLGVTDSVKTFALAANGTVAGQMPIDGFQMQLSKEHGLIEYVPFVLFLYHPASTGYRSFKLAGMDNAGSIHGYRQSGFSDYFHLSVGDILLWKTVNDPDDYSQPTTTAYRRDSITNSEITPDAVTYTFDEIYQHPDHSFTQTTGMTAYYSRSDLAKFLDVAPNDMALGTGMFDSGTGMDMLWGSGPLRLSLAANGNDTITSFAFGTDGSMLDTTNCFVVPAWDTGFGWTFDTRAGLDAYCYYAFGIRCTTLIAWRISGEQVGDIALSIDELDASDRGSLIYPNPVTDRVFLHDKALVNGATYAIYDGLGHQVRSGEISGNGIAVQDLPKGLYVVHIIRDRRTVIARFVKE
jgi:hypothetical protein